VPPSKIRICQEKGCRNVQTTKGYCRLHYLKNWRTAKEQRRRRAGEKLNRYVEGIMKRHGDRYVDAARKEMRREIDFDETPSAGFNRDEMDDILEDLGFQDDSTLDRLLSQLKIDKGF